jgi:hypothetical protein
MNVNLSDFIAELRQNDGKVLRRLLRLLRQKDDPDSKDLYVMLVQHPELYDLVRTAFQATVLTASSP